MKMEHISWESVYQLTRTPAFQIGSEHVCSRLGQLGLWDKKTSIVMDHTLQSHCMVTNTCVEKTIKYGFVQQGMVGNGNHPTILVKLGI